MSNTTYTAITIGPIYKTISDAKRTRAVWAASYFFSWFSRRILEEAMNANMQVFLPDTSGVQKDANGKFQGLKSKNGAGFYADRLYFINDEHTNKDKLKQIVEQLYLELTQKSLKDKDFISNYLNVHIIEKTITEDDLKNNYPLAILNNILDQKELHQNFNFDFEENKLQALLNKKNGEDSFLSVDAFGNEKQRVFKSISEIATTSFARDKQFNVNYKKAVLNDLKSKGEGDLMEELRKSNLPLMPAHKYFAVLYADGDNIGKLLKDINQKNLDLKKFSKSLFDFGQKAEKTIADYGGSGIYLGGEDILVFAPVVCLNKDNTAEQYTIFKLIEQLDEDFAQTVQQYAKENSLPIPTLSFGVMTAYYKHPLKEVMNKAYNLLSEKAKEGNKNKIAFLFQKHSGQQFEAIIDKNDSKTTQLIYGLIEQYCKKPKTQEDKADELLSSIIQRYRDAVFVQLFSESIENKTLEALFQNFFNEKIHKDSANPKTQFLEAVKNFSESIYKQYEDKTLAIKNIFTVLRFIHFVNSQKEN